MTDYSAEKMAIALEHIADGCAKSLRLSTIRLKKAYPEFFKDIEYKATEVEHE